LEKVRSACQDKKATTANRCIEFQKRSQLFIGSHNETLSIAAMCIGDEDRSPI